MLKIKRNAKNMRQALENLMHAAVDFNKTLPDQDPSPAAIKYFVAIDEAKHFLKKKATAPETIQDTEVLAKIHDDMNYAQSSMEDEVCILVPVTLGDLRRAHRTWRKANGEVSDD